MASLYLVRHVILTKPSLGWYGKCCYSQPVVLPVRLSAVQSCPVTSPFRAGHSSPVASNLPRIPSSVSTAANAGLTNLTVPITSSSGPVSRPQSQPILPPSESEDVWHQFQARLEACCRRVGRGYCQHASRCLTVALLLGLLLILTKHLVVFRYVDLDSRMGCYSQAPAEWRDYFDFVTQAVLSYCIIFPANIIVYRAIRRHQQSLTRMRMSAIRGSQSHQHHHHQLHPQHQYNPHKGRRIQPCTTATVTQRQNQIQAGGVERIPSCTQLHSIFPLRLRIHT
ncbi:unnamed protein product [Protopolystoma xenopodis]|uniref:Uncharacterized protein n=1 Tax=Protopolystoma xenopodis TaxID=117903 RepID=A0A448XGD9_9PLAT|nr:unnamed protein product [Protopolystoma xenopodis]